VTNKRKDLRNDKRCGFEIIKARDIDRIGIQGVINALKKRVGNTKVYISVDIDALDPAFAPGTFIRPCGGISKAQLTDL
jgi:agmatinase